MDIFNSAAGDLLVTAVARTGAHLALTCAALLILFSLVARRMGRPDF